MQRVKSSPFIGYCQYARTYKLWDFVNQKVREYREVNFHECFPLASLDTIVFPYPSWQFEAIYGLRALRCEWVYKTKLKADGTVARNKVRLVAKGFLQVPDINFNET